MSHLYSMSRSLGFCSVALCAMNESYSSNVKMYETRLVRETCFIAGVMTRYCKSKLFNVYRMYDFSAACSIVRRSRI